MNREKRKILFVCPSFSSFIQNDLNTLSRHFEVRVVHYRGKKGLLKFSIEILKGILWADLTFSWFADVHALAAVLFSKIFRRKSIVVVGGYEVAKVPEIKYGGMLSKRKTFIVKFVLKHTDEVLAVSEFSKEEILKCASPKRIDLVYNSIRSDIFKPIGKKKDIVMTISAGNTWDRAQLKGLDTFVKTAAFLPEVTFMVVGIGERIIEELIKIANPNVDFIGPLPQEGLIFHYQKAKVYCQLSMYESFGMTLAEAMACGCVPVTTDTGALPEVAGDTGFYVPYGDPEATAEAIKEALKSDKGNEGRARIYRMFLMGRREKELVQIIKDV